MFTPIIGITLDNRDNSAASGRYEVGALYAQRVVEAGGTPVLLPHELACVERYVALCDALVLTGGVDPRTEAFGQPTHPKARPLDPQRQAFELALLEALDRQRSTPVLGVCLGMQLMALRAGGRLDQYLPETLGDDAAALHQDNRQHTLQITDEAAVARLLIEPGHSHGRGAQDNDDTSTATVTSSHRQAVAEPGRLRVLATAPDGVIEAIVDPDRPFYLGVQWHPERGDASPVNAGLFALLLQASASARHAT